jgi:hypothetical protein
MSEDSRPRSRMVFGRLAEIVQDQLDSRYMFLQFTTNQMWENLEIEDREEMREAYGDVLRARTAMAGQLSSHNYTEVVKRHRRGETVWIYKPKVKEVHIAAARAEVGDQTTFTMVGHTSDGSPLWRDEASGSLGWFEFKEL